MKNIFKLLVLSLTINFMSLAVEAQDSGECIMFDANGKPIDLSYLCDPGNRSKKASTQEANTGIFTTPIKRREHGIPVIDVQFDGKHTFEMFLDTGASFTVVTPNMAKTLGIKQEGIMLMNTPSDSRVEVPTGRVNSAVVGGAVSNNLIVAISTALPLGLLGQNFFSHYDVTIKQDVIEFRQR
jgi:aspartyl protease family protein